jgi:type IV pilus assembly protein PilE
LNKETDVNIYKNQAAFTLVELLVVVAIVGILSAFAIPTYTKHVLTARRAEGKAALLAGAGALERYYTMNNTYTTSLSAAGVKAFSGDNSSASAYTISVAAGSAGIGTSFTLQATPQLSDGLCGNLSINQAGVKSFSGSGTVQSCW